MRRPVKWGDQRLPAHFWIKTVVNGATGCWEWQGKPDKDGYGRFRVGSKIKRAHRVAFETLMGPITEETLNHDCRVRHCVNPNRGHAYTPMSSADNVREGKALVTHCPQDHEYTEANIIWVGPNKDRRGCRKCYNARSGSYWKTTRSGREKEQRRANGYRGGVDETDTCPQGHERTPENTYVTPQGYKTCRPCRSKRAADHAARQRAQRPRTPQIAQSCVSSESA